MKQTLTYSMPEPYDVEAALLAGILKSKHPSDVLARVMERVPSEDSFSATTHRKVYRAMLDLFSTGGAIDTVTVKDKTRVEGSHIATLLDAGSPVNVDQYAESVSNEHVRREIIRIAADAIARAERSDCNVDELLDTADSGIFAVRHHSSRVPVVSLRDVMDEAMDRIDKYQTGEIHNQLTYTGFSDVDKILEIAPGQLIVVGGATSQGKTQFGLQIAEYNAIQRNRPTCIFSLEMDAVALTIRCLASVGKMNKAAFKKKGGLTADEFRHLQGIAGDISDKPLYVADIPQLTPMGLRSSLRQMVSTRGINLAVVDYLQLMSPDLKQRDSNEYREISQITRALKMSAKELRIPIILLSQLSRTHQHERRLPGGRDLRGSGSIEQDADAIVFVFRGEVGRGKSAFNTERIIIEKQRDGETGYVEMAFINGRWELLAKHQEVA
jgi:replicative DNA helicase